MKNLILDEPLMDYKSPFLSVKIIGSVTNDKGKVFPLLGVVYDVEKNINVDVEGIVTPKLKLPIKFKKASMYYDANTLSKGLENLLPKKNETKGLTFYWNYSYSSCLRPHNRDLNEPFFLTGNYGLELDSYPCCKDYHSMILSLMYHLGVPSVANSVKKKYTSLKHAERRFVVFLFDTRFLRVAYDETRKTPTVNLPKDYVFDTIKPYDEVFNENTDKYLWLSKRYKILPPWE